jgi:hypothetical protein
MLSVRFTASMLEREWVNISDLHIYLCVLPHITKIVMYIALALESIMSQFNSVHITTAVQKIVM